MRSSTGSRSSTRSQSGRYFFAEPISDKPVTAVSGIGRKLGSRLEAEGFDSADVLFGQFLVLKGDEMLFCAWLKDICGANSGHARECYRCLDEWKELFM